MGASYRRVDRKIIGKKYKEAMGKMGLFVKQKNDRLLKER